MQEHSPTFRIQRARTAGHALERDVSASRTLVIDDSVGYLVNLLARLLSRVQARCVEQQGVMLGQWPVLMWLWVDDGMTQTELSRLVAIDGATMVRTLDRMERDGLVQRQRNRNDRRQINVLLTERGRALRTSLIPCAIATNRAATHALDDAEYAALLDLLHRMIASLERPALPASAGSQLDSSAGSDDDGG